MSEDEYYAMHREAEQGDDKNKYDDKELDRAFADLDKDNSSSLSLDEWRRPFEEHTDAWLQVNQQTKQENRLLVFVTTTAEISLARTHFLSIGNRHTQNTHTYTHAHTHAHARTHTH